MGVDIVAVAREVLERAAQLLALIDLYRPGHKRADLVGVLGEGTQVHELLLVGGDVTDGREVHVDAQGQEQIRLFGLRSRDCLPASVGVIFFRRNKRLVAEVGADAHDRAALFINGNQHGDTGGVLPALNLRLYLFPAPVRKVAVKEDIAAQVVFFRGLQGFLLGTAREKHLTDLLLKAHCRDHLVELVNGGLGRLGRGCRSDHRRFAVLPRLRRGALRGAGGQTEQQRQYDGNG